MSLASFFLRFRLRYRKGIGRHTSPDGPWWLRGAICLAMRAPGELFGAVEGSLGAKMGAQGCLKKPKELPRRPQEHQKRTQNIEITIHRPCRRFRASQVTIYRPCRVIMSAEKRSKERPSHDPSALSTFQEVESAQNSNSGRVEAAILDTFITFEASQGATSDFDLPIAFL